MDSVHPPAANAAGDEWKPEPPFCCSMLCCQSTYRVRPGDDARCVQSSDHALIPRVWQPIAGLPCIAGFLIGLMLFTGLGEARNLTEFPSPLRSTPTSILSVQVTGDSVSVNVQDVPVVHLLNEISHYGTLAVILYGRPEGRVTAQFERLSLPEALERILRHNSYALEYVDSSTYNGESGHARPSRLWVFADGPKGGLIHPQAFGSASISDLSHSNIAPAGGISSSIADDEAALEQNPMDSESSLAHLSYSLIDDITSVRVDAIRGLADIGGDTAAAALAVTLYDENPVVRKETVYALGDIGGAQAIQLLTQALNDEASDVRNVAIDAFIDIGGDESSQALIVALHNEDARTRAQVIDALGIIGGKTAFSLIRQQAEIDNDPEIRELATRVLAEMPNEDLLE